MKGTLPELEEVGLSTSSGSSTDLSEVRSVVGGFVAEGATGWLSTTGEVLAVDGPDDLPGADAPPILDGELVGPHGESMSVRYVSHETGWAWHTIREGGDPTHVRVEQQLIAIHPRLEQNPEAHRETRVSYAVYWPILAALEPLSDGQCPQVGPEYVRFLGFSSATDNREGQ